MIKTEFDHSVCVIVSECGKVKDLTTTTTSWSQLSPEKASRRILPPFISCIRACGICPSGELQYNSRFLFLYNYKKWNVFSKKEISILNIFSECKNDQEYFIPLDFTYFRFKLLHEFGITIFFFWNSFSLFIN